MGPPRPVLQTYLAVSAAAGPSRVLFRAGRNFLRFELRNLCCRDRLVSEVTRAPPKVAPGEAKQAEVRVVLGWVVTFLIIALIAGVLGFGGIAGASIEIAKIIFVIALVLFLVSAIFGLVRGRRI